MRTETFIRRVRIAVSAEEAFAWHARPGALERLTPPWENVRVVGGSGGVNDGAQVEMLVRIGPATVRWVAEHRDYQAGRQFRDVAIAGPFPSWNHLHRFEPDGPDASWLEDRIEYALPGGALGAAFGASMVKRRLERMFRYRHDTAAADLAIHAKHADRPRLTVGVTGASGLVGSSLLPFLTTGGHCATGIPREKKAAELFSVETIRSALRDTRNFAENSSRASVSAVVHLAGESIGAGRWNAAKKARIRDSRVLGTRALCQAIGQLDPPPRVLVCASAVGFYGSRGDEVLDEQSSPGSGFLTAVTQDWEAAVQPAIGRGIRVVLLRFGMILSPRGGALAQMLVPFRAGLGGRIGSGRQYWSWISLDDALGAIHHALMTDALAGPVNAVGPQPATNAELIAALGQVLHRPTLAPVPAWAARAALGEMADELLLASARVRPAKLLQTGYEFRHANLPSALRHVLGRPLPL